MLGEAAGRRFTAQDIHATGSHALPLRLQRALGPDYRVLRELGGGGMSRLFLAEQRVPHRLVVAKVLEQPDIEELNRFREEVAVTAALQHPHVLPVLAAGETAELAYLVTPYVAGGSLRDRLRAGPAPSAAECVRLVRELAGALAHVHAQGVVHGDVKPENVLLQHGHALLADFGAARRARQPWTVAPDGAAAAVGTPLYMSPEQAAGDPDVGPGSDVYSLGVLAFELLAGRPPFAGPTPRAVLLAHLGEPAPCLARLRPDAPPALVEVIAAALAKDPAARPANGTAMATALDRRAPLRTPVPAARPAGHRAPLPAAAWRQRAAAMIGAVAATAGGLGLGTLSLAAAALALVSFRPSDRTVPPHVPTTIAATALPAAALPPWPTPPPAPSAAPAAAPESAPAPAPADAPDVARVVDVPLPAVRLPAPPAARAVVRIRAHVAALGTCDSAATRRPRVVITRSASSA